MNRLSIAVITSLIFSVLFIGPAPAFQLPTSDLVVEVLSVDQASFDRSPTMVSQGQAVREWLEVTSYVAKARIQNVIRTDHGLAPGQTVDLHYVMRAINSRPMPSNIAPLKPGDSLTIHVYKDGNGYVLSH